MIRGTVAPTARRGQEKSVRWRELVRSLCVIRRLGIVMGDGGKLGKWSCGYPGQGCRLHDTAGMWCCFDGHRFQRTHGHADRLARNRPRSRAAPAATKSRLGMPSGHGTGTASPPAPSSRMLTASVIVRTLPKSSPAHNLHFLPTSRIKHDLSLRAMRSLRFNCNVGDQQNCGEASGAKICAGGNQAGQLQQASGQCEFRPRTFPWGRAESRVKAGERIAHPSVVSLK